MSNPFLGEIRLFAGNFAPANWALCQGQFIAISQNQALFELIGTTYGGDGVNTFQLPDLQGRVPIHVGEGIGLSNYFIGQSGGEETVILNLQQIPAHRHPVVGAGSATASVPSGDLLAATSPDMIYTSSAPNSQITGTVPAGNNAPHNNLMPYLSLSYIIALSGVFPSQS